MEGHHKSMKKWLMWPLELSSQVPLIIYEWLINRITVEHNYIKYN